MNGTTDDSGSGGGRPGRPRTTPIAAIAGAIVLVGLVATALYRRAAAPPAPEATPAAAGETVPAADGTTPADASAPVDVDAPRGAPPPRTPANPVETEVTGTPIVAQAPTRLSPEANILAERYRCVCGCNDPLGLCTCRLARGSEEMKTFLEGLAVQRLLPEEIDRAMTGKYGTAVLLSNPAPPQTQPSHVTGASRKKTG